MKRGSNGLPFTTKTAERTLGNTRPIPRALRDLGGLPCAFFQIVKEHPRLDTIRRGGPGLFPGIVFIHNY
jgi:hypothetical protein